MSSSLVFYGVSLYNFEACLLEMRYLNRGEARSTWRLLAGGDDPDQALRRAGAELAELTRRGSGHVDENIMYGFCSALETHSWPLGRVCGSPEQLQEDFSAGGRARYNESCLWQMLTQRALYGLHPAADTRYRWGWLELGEIEYFLASRRETENDQIPAAFHDALVAAEADKSDLVVVWNCTPVLDSEEDLSAAW